MAERAAMILSPCNALLTSLCLSVLMHRTLPEYEMELELLRRPILQIHELQDVSELLNRSRSMVTLKV